MSTVQFPRMREILTETRNRIPAVCEDLVSGALSARPKFRYSRVARMTVIGEQPYIIDACKPLQYMSL